MKEVLQHKDTAFQVMLSRLVHAGILRMNDTDRENTARHMVLLCTWCLSYAYVLNPRGALEEDNAPRAMVEAARSMLALIKPYASPKQAAAFERVMGAMTPRAQQT
jgi:hypothetical protein